MEAIPSLDTLAVSLSGTTEDSKHFVDAIRAYNWAFGMTCFKANVIHKPGYMLTSKVQGQVYHVAGLLGPGPGQESDFLRIPFMDNHDAQAEQRCPGT